ncbi:nuclear transport factor 2 family protein [Microbacterium sp. KHB019]|uniref:nuclear transport factor 2 family protein n=1 Tax=Microbacterium sp. KHB019 TaxID=3129770 RepID=UPI00307B0979
MTNVTDDNLIATVQRLVDENEIQRVLFDYAFHLDAADPDKMIPLFTPDLYIAYGPEHGAEGAEAYLETLSNENTGIAAFFAGTSHHVSNVVIDFVDADTANVRSVLYAYHKYNRERPDGIVYGQYHDIFVRTPEGWRIKRRELKHAGTETYHAKGAALNPIPRNSKQA